MSTYPYAERFDVMRGLPSEGRSESAILDDLREMATEENAQWETGQCSGTMYCGDHEHYAFMNEAFGLFAHMNALLRGRFEELLACAASPGKAAGKRAPPRQSGV